MNTDKRRQKEVERRGRLQELDESDGESGDRLGKDLQNLGAGGKSHQTAHAGCGQNPYGKYT
jgi:hypothetical protein